MSVIAFTVSRRTREIGLRTALGASRRRTLLQFLGRGLRLAAGGALLGSVVAVVVGRQVGALGAVVLDPGMASLVGAALVLVAIALLGCLVPALRATRVAPAVALNE